MAELKFEQLISEGEWNDLSELKNGFNLMDLESHVNKLIAQKGYFAFEAFVFKIHFFLEAIKSCSEEHPAGAKYRLSLSIVLNVFLHCNLYFSVSPY